MKRVQAEVKISEMCANMKAMILNGDLKGHDGLAGIQGILEEELKEAGWNAETYILNEHNIKSCIGCFKCWDTTPGICTGVKNDDANKIVEKVIQNELLVFLTPLTFGGYSSELKAIIERMLGLLQPGVMIVDGESHHLKRYERYLPHSETIFIIRFFQFFRRISDK
ncbi:MAG: flavodoxin family protein [Candidatus Hodarchaeales archaeon]